MTWSPKHKAFTLLESLITVLMVMLVFGLLAELLIGSFRITRFERQKSESAEAAQLALNRIICEAREACKIVVQSSNTEIILTKFNPAKAQTMQLDLNRFHYLLEVRYYLDSNNSLLRDVRDLFAGTLDTYAIADNIQGCKFKFIDDGQSNNLEVTLTTQSQGHLHIVSSEVDAQAFIP